jgi:transposase
LEQSWLLLELKQRFGFSLEELGRRFGRSVSWVSRRLALVQELPEVVQQRVQRGEIVAHGAAKYLVPLARANRQVCLELVEGIGSTRLTSCDLGILYRAYQTGNWVTRQRLLEAPLVFLKSHKIQAAPALVEPSLGDSLLSDLEVLSSAARRADPRLRQGVLRNLADPQRQELACCLDQSLHERSVWRNGFIGRRAMLDQSTRAAILKLEQQGHSIRGIARALKLSRGAVRQVLRSATEIVPRRVRPEKATPYREQILKLYARCKGNLVRVHEELVVAGAQLCYQALTAFCRRQGIGRERKQPVGEYHFEPGQEMQHDTSPHRVEIGGQLRLVQTASLVLCYSRMLFFQFFPTFTRFDCKVFLSDALPYFGGSCDICMIDNTHVVVLQGTGRDMVPVPEMAAFAERYGFRFKAHEKEMPIAPPVWLKVRTPFFTGRRQPELDIARGFIFQAMSCGNSNSTGKLKVKRCSSSGVRGGPDVATMRRDYRASNRQTQTCALSLRGEERVKHLVHITSGQSNAGIADRDQQLTILG